MPKNYRLVPAPPGRVAYGILMPQAVRFAQLLVTGPPGSGKSTFIRQIGGYPDEVSIDISSPEWWRIPHLAYRPRELHMSLPLVGYPVSQPVYAETLLADKSELQVDASRIAFPPEIPPILSCDWRRRLVFEFLLPPAEVLLGYRQGRAESSSHPLDRQLSLELVARQIQLYRQTAIHFHEAGMQVYVLESWTAPPLCLSAD